MLKKSFKVIRRVFIYNVIFLCFQILGNFNSAFAQSQFTSQDSAKVKAALQSSGVVPQSSSQSSTDLGTPRETTSENNLTIKRPSSNIFGAQLFSTQSLSFQPNLRIATPTNYVLGPDDEILINVSGYQETNLKAVVLPEGGIFIPQVGVINVNGLSIENATSVIRSKMAHTAYPSLANGSSKLNITLGNIKSIHITIIGGYKPGAYTVSSLTTVFNALFLCGGPGDINTYRNIELVRGGHIVQKLDIYQFLTRGELQGNLILKEGDVINIPIYQKHVTVGGEVKRQGIFELKSQENFNDLIFFAGGYNDRAFKATIKIRQITDTERRIKDISKAEMSTYIPSNGDEFQIDAILDRLENAVSISGAVYRPGEFELTTGMTVGDLIRKAGGLMENVFPERAILTRTHIDGTRENISFNVANLMNGMVHDVLLVKHDVIVIATLNQFISDYSITISGEVRSPGTLPYNRGMSLKDVFFLANGFTDAASSFHVEISRRLTDERSNKRSDTIAKVFDFNTTKDLAIENSKFLVQPYDVITVRRNPGYVEQQRVTISGEVNFPGAYTIETKKERISDLLKRAGGITTQAYSQGVFLIRGDQINAARTNTIRNIQRNIRDTSVTVVEEITRINNRIAIDLNKVLNEPGSTEDYILESGDQIQVLKIDPLVKINGEVLSATRSSFIQDQPLEYYIGQAGGFSEYAKRRKTFVLYANGTAKRTKNGFFGLFRSYPKIEAGAEIVVPKKVEHKSGGLTTAELATITTAVVSLVSLIVVTISTIRK